jgi:Protein of unknown function (DUF2505)
MVSRRSLAVVRLHAEHHFDATPSAVVDAMLDPEFVPELQALPAVGSVEVVSQESDGSVRRLSIRLQYVGAVEGIAAKVLGPTAPSWVQTYEFDDGACRGSLVITPDVHASLFDCSAEIDVTATPQGARRVVDGTLKVRLPLVAGKAEQALGPPILERIGQEAELLGAWLRR